MSISVSTEARGNLRRWTQQATARRRRIDDALNNATTLEIIDDFVMKVGDGRCRSLRKLEKAFVGATLASAS